jgi:hypothetical protein
MKVEGYDPAAKVIEVLAHRGLKAWRSWDQYVIDDRTAADVLRRKRAEFRGGSVRVVGSTRTRGWR